MSAADAGRCACGCHEYRAGDPDNHCSRCRTPAPVAKRRLPRPLYGRQLQAPAPVAERCAECGGEQRVETPDGYIVDCPVCQPAKPVADGVEILKKIEEYVNSTAHPDANRVAFMAREAWNRNDLAYHEAMRAEIAALREEVERLRERCGDATTALNDVQEAFQDEINRNSAVRIHDYDENQKLRAALDTATRALESCADSTDLVAWSVARKALAQIGRGRK